MTDLPVNKSLMRRDLYAMTVLEPLERVTRSLRYGDGHNLDDLRPLAQRCRALADAYDARKNEIIEDDDDDA